MLSPKSDELSFLNITAADVLKWDREWAFYFRRFMNREWFVNLAFSTDQTRKFRTELAGLQREDVFYFKGPLDRLELFVDASELIDVNIGEIGCGAGRLGRQLGHLANDYIGIDYSDLAVHIAAPLSPSKCHYFCIRDKDQILKFKQTRDIIVARHFFIHNNFNNATWLLKLAKWLIKPTGTIVADFYFPADPAKDESFHRLAKDDLDPRSPSRVFLFSEAEIKELAEKVGLRIQESEVKMWDGYGGREGRRFVRFTQ